MILSIILQTGPTAPTLLPFPLLLAALTALGFVIGLVCRALVPDLFGLSFMANGPMAGWPAWTVSLFGALFGALIGGGSLWLIGWLWQRLRGVEAMGLGDVKMMFMVGAMLGWRLTILTIFLGVLSGSIIGIGLMLRRGERDMKMLLPFGIFLGIGSIIALCTGTRIIMWYLA